MVEKIHENKAIMYRDRVTNAPVEALEINDLADESLKQSQFSIIGSGMDLLEFKGNKVPSTARHTFDSINPKEPQIYHPNGCSSLPSNLCALLKPHQAARAGFLPFS